MLLTRSRSLTVALILLLATVSFFFIYRPNINERFHSITKTDSQIPLPPTTDNDILETTHDSQYPSAAPGDCPPTAEWLRELSGLEDLHWPLRYARRDIIVRANPNLSRDSITRIPGESLIPEFQELKAPEAPELAQGSKTCRPPVKLDVPIFERHVGASHILLGAATSLERLEMSLPFFARWMGRGSVRLVVVVTPGGDTSTTSTHPPGTHPPGAIAEMEMRMRGLGMDVKLVEPWERKGENIHHYLSLIKVLWQERGEGTRWFGFVDDDTFFTNLGGLVRKLETFDAGKMWYLGAVSEEWWTVTQYSWIAMGGGGIFLSGPLLEVLDREYEGCKGVVKRIFGDHRLYECIAYATDTRLTQFDGLYQMDLHGDRSGVFESGREILTMHHWKEGYWSENGAGADGIRHSRWFPMDKMSLVQDVCGEECFLQRWLFGKDTVVTNGYSVAVYPKGSLKDVKFREMEKTWVTSGEVEGSLNLGYDHYLGPLRPALELEKEKIHYRFLDAKIVPGGGVRQYYRRIGRDGRQDELLELYWTFEGEDRDKPGNGTVR